MRVRDIEVGNLFGETSKFRIYLGVQGDGEFVILKVAKTFESGAALAEEASKLNTLCYLEKEIHDLEAEQGKNSHYDWLFARLKSSFMEPTQQNRRINVYTTPDIDSATLIPLSKLSANTKIDAKTSVWILGRFFKFYSFYELTKDENDSATRYPTFSPGDYLIGPDKHRLIYFNHSGEMQAAVANDFVKAIVEFILDWTIIEDSPDEQRYLELLNDFALYGRSSIAAAHKELYNLVDEIWGVKFHPFTYRKTGTTIWTTKEG